MFQTQEADTDEGEEKMTEEDESERDAVGGDQESYVRDKMIAPHLKPLLSVSFASVCTACMICLLCQIYSILLTFIATTHHSLLQICDDTMLHGR